MVTYDRVCVIDYFELPEELQATIEISANDVLLDIVDDFYDCERDNYEENLLHTAQTDNLGNLSIDDVADYFGESLNLWIARNIPNYWTFEKFYIRVSW